MDEVSWDTAMEVADAHAALQAASDNSAGTLLLKTPEGGLYTLGSRYWLAVGTKLIREYPHQKITIIVDAGSDAGIAMGAISDGHLAVRFTGDEETKAHLKQIAAGQSIAIVD